MGGKRGGQAGPDYARPGDDRHCLHHQNAWRRDQMRRSFIYRHTYTFGALGSRLRVGELVLEEVN